MIEGEFSDKQSLPNIDNPHYLFAKEWINLGCPPLEFRNPVYPGWTPLSNLPFEWLEKTEFRFANDRHFSLRRKWIDSNKTLPIETLFDGEWRKFIGYNIEWNQNSEYREAQVAEEINHPEYGIIRSHHDESALSTQVGGEHYKNMKIQPVEFITANNLGFIQGSVIKYITRYKSKNGKQDLEKAKHFIDLLIELEYGKQ